MNFDWNCPLPQTSFEQIVIGHGGGGRLTHELLTEVIAPELGAALTLHGMDAGLLPPDQGRQNQKKTQTQPQTQAQTQAQTQTQKQTEEQTPAASLNEASPALQKPSFVFTTDSFVVDPIFFPGGDIGKLSVVGTVNDIAMMGGEPLGLSLSFILEEGFLISEFRQILRSIAKELNRLDLKIACGDTKVVPRGKGDRVFINTSAVGKVDQNNLWQPRRISVGDVAIVSRDIGAHGGAILCARHQLGLKSTIESDCHELLTMTRALKAHGVEVHCARDLTRGGLLAGAVELAMQSGMNMEFVEDQIPLNPSVAALGEVLGVDIFALANEGTALFVLPESEVEKALFVLETFDYAKGAAVVGRVTSEARGSKAGHCHLRLGTGLVRKWSLPEGEVLPRIC